MEDPRSSVWNRRSFLGGTVLTGGLLLVGCDGDGAKGGGNSEHLHVGIADDVLPSSILRFIGANRCLRRTVYDVLLERNSDGSYVPSLATSWEWNTAKTTLVLNLQQGVTFHSGRSFGPEDVVFSIQQALLPKSGAQVLPMLKRARAVKATGTSQVTVTFDQPFTHFLDALAILTMVDKETYDDIATGKQLVGTGPFTWESWTPGSKVVMAKNDSYWQQGKPHLEGVELSIFKQSQAMLAALQSEQLELGLSVLARDAATLQKDKRFTVSSEPGIDFYVSLNTKIKPLDDTRVRQAIAYATDRKRVSDQVFKGFAEPSCVLWDSSTPGITESMINRYAYDIDKAKNLLAQAGAVSAKLDLTLAPADPAFGAAADIVQFGLEQAGLKISRVTLSTADFQERIQAFNLPALMVGHTGLTRAGPVPTLMSASTLTAAANAANFTPPQYAKLVNAVVSASSEDATKNVIAELSEYMLTQAFHNTMVQEKSPLVAVKKLSGVRTDTTSAVVLTDATLQR